VRILPRVLAVVATTTALVGAGAPSAVAAPEKKGTTTVAPSTLTAGVLQGLTGPARLTGAGAVFGIVGNSKNGVIKHVGGLTVTELDPATAATSITLSNFWIDTTTGTVSAIVAGVGRVDVFSVDAAGTLRFTSTASAAISGGSTLAGAVAGTATVAPA
jgi:hypothetical protein